MSLSQQAEQLHAQRREDALQRGREQRQEEREFWRERLVKMIVADADTDEFDIKFLTCTRVRYPERATGQFNPNAGRIFWSERLVYRFQVDDVVIRCYKGGYPEHQAIGPEVECACCQRAISPEEADEYASGYHSKLVDAVAESVGKTWTCAHCAVEIPETCPTCGRPNR